MNQTFLNQNILLIKNNVVNTKIVLTFILLSFCVSGIKAQTNFVWGKQFGTSKNEYAITPVADQNGNVYISGSTSGNLSGENHGKTDGYVTKIDSIGNIVWTKQFGSGEDDKVNWLAMDKKGNLYAVGTTKGILHDKNYGHEDIMVVKLDNSGNIEWQKQYGTDSTDIGNSIFVDTQGNIYVTGSTKGIMGKSSFGKSDGVILKLDTKGNQLFISQFGAPGDNMCTGITGDDASNIYVCGFTTGDLAAKNKGKYDAFIGKFDNQGKQIRLFQFGTDN
jgi:hypothetical protein